MSVGSGVEEGETEERAGEGRGRVAGGEEAIEEPYRSVKSGDERGRRRRVEEAIEDKQRRWKKKTSSALATTRSSAPGSGSEI